MKYSKYRDYVIQVWMMAACSIILMAMFVWTGIGYLEGVVAFQKTLNEKDARITMQEDVINKLTHKAGDATLRAAYCHRGKEW